MDDISEDEKVAGQVFNLRLEGIEQNALKSQQAIHLMPKKNGARKFGCWSL